MPRVAQNEPSLDYLQMTEQIMASGQISREQHQMLTSAILSNKITDQEKHQINRVFDSLQTDASVKLTD
ncbi:MAG: hypothetical protein GDA43_17410 [Hormoscilla sp. SP5CHS1]|nr:hypothetical protein [Hormoscilla sp. SP12CHS1]MBC6454758.1 hypothetical protein [Hormoscilla sp. SP5CHS1]MBC6471981.1 hypothetical protein [Hormoscilla sp. GM102CHS1]